ncbi:MAG: multidrug DMT transporter permease [Gammaproteobacteria bacterium]|nr:MAG: multidrug DMT transporter permease [Gammaproteobacteria bacterium]UTW43476.1 multidrug DMT transporter permease [bacterium SCSIO 12844]
MFVLESYPIAVLFCIITMLCWGSWANTQKLATKSWPFQLFYWDYALGILIISFVIGITMGSFGDAGRSFFNDLSQASATAITSAFIGGIIFNLANILLVAAIDIAGMSIAFPIAIGLALVIGVIVNYIEMPIGNPLLIFTGVVLVTLAIICTALAYKRISSIQNTSVTKGIIIAIISGILMGFFYRFVASSMITNVYQPQNGLMSAYSASFIFAVGIFISNFIINGCMMKFPITGKKLNFKDYFCQGNLWLHFIGILGGIIWGIGSTLNFIAANLAGAAISYGLGQGATLIAAIWGVFIWKEFSSAPKGTNKLLTLMFLLYIVGLALIVISKII